MPNSTCFKSITIYSTENRFRFMANLRSQAVKSAEKLTLPLDQLQPARSLANLFTGLKQVFLWALDQGQPPLAGLARFHFA
jgi:hypothetical protein